MFQYICVDYIIKLIEKKNWGGFLITITFWDFLIIDVDLNILLDDIIELIKYKFPNDTYYIHKTSKGYLEKKVSDNNKITLHFSDTKQTNSPR